MCIESLIFSYIESGQDYEAVDFTFTMGICQIRDCYLVKILNDNVFEDKEIFYISLESPQDRDFVLESSEVNVTIYGMEYL